MKRIIIIIAAGLMMIFWLVALSRAAQVTLAWDANQPNPEGYRVFQRIQGATYNYAIPAWPTDDKHHTETTCTITGLADGETYFFVVRAYVGTDVSGDSNEVSFNSQPQEPDDSNSTTPDPPNNLEQAKIIEQLYRIEANQKIILEILAGGTTPQPPPAAPYCGNPDSKILHESSHWCGAGAVQFNTKEEAIAAGYRPCGICKP